METYLNVRNNKRKFSHRSLVASNKIVTHFPVQMQFLNNLNSFTGNLQLSNKNQAITSTLLVVKNVVKITKAILTFHTSDTLS